MEKFSSKINNKMLGAYAEDLAVRWLEKQGYKVLDRNLRLGPFELDIVAKDKTLICFIEVKSERSEFFKTYPSDKRVSFFKRMHIIHAAKAYLKKAKHEGSYRFDIVKVRISKQKKTDFIIIKNAFNELGERNLTLN